MRDQIPGRVESEAVVNPRGVRLSLRHPSSYTIGNVPDMKLLPCLSLLAASLMAVCRPGAAAPAEVFDYSKLRLVEEVDCAAVGGGENFREFPEAGSRVEEVLGKRCRVLPNDSSLMKYVAYRVGRGKGLKAGGAYLLVLEYPEDLPRTMYLLNRGNETGRGLSTGSAVADNIFGRYVNNNPESIGYALSGEWRKWEQFFYLHDRFPEAESLRGAMPRTAKPEDGFWVYVAQTKQVDALGSAGAAVGRIRLFEVPEPREYDLAVNYPPAGLPRRNIFCREEMADGVVSVPHGTDEPAKRGFDNPVDWFEYKARNMVFLGMNTFTKDLLEFGHNQGWDSGDERWYVGSSTPKLWGDILTMLKRYPQLSVLPMYEYGGGTGEAGVGRAKKPVRLSGGKDYIQIQWLNDNAHVNILDPEALADAKRLLYATVLKYRDTTHFVGAWFRERPVQMPISFSDSDLDLYEAEKGARVTREKLAADAALLAGYYDWWMTKRHAFMQELVRYLRESGLPDAKVLLTCDASEPGVSLPGNVLVTDDVAKWEELMKGPTQKKSVLSFDEVVKQALHVKQLTQPAETYGNWEWQHAVPWADPQNYSGADGVMLSYTFHRLYSVSSPALFEPFQDADGLAVVRHHSLNENTMDDKLGYFACDVEPAGAYSMMAEARAVANGDPRYLGYLISNTLVRGFPAYVREFDRAYLALPALPSQVVPGASSVPEVVVRTIDAGRHGRYYAVVNTGLSACSGVRISLPAGKSLQNAATGAPMDRDGGGVVLDFYPGQLYALRAP